MLQDDSTEQLRDQKRAQAAGKDKRYTKCINVADEITVLLRKLQIQIVKDLCT